ncbi:class I SAM-dependent DNA methyltransferase [Stenotrophomonas rhizophila]|uniref:class I SAM-dependent DNA methyltransferase n=1 Tax=Stenotrophomonas rhizophila TaxID=216778 RepID=UPI0010C000C2|nr:class I SAM-dependent methyltransferase [Stenotrophomonas rhizophila]TKK10189.1 methyltransferase [Stenotrophomonas rhizophila]
MDKTYDADYFKRWYQADQAGGAARLARKVALAVSSAEYYLERPIRSVLDIGCGEGAWRAPLLKLRPRVQYLGFDSSAYAIQRYGRSRNLHMAKVGDFAWLRPCAPVDLLICSDVMHYVPSRELRPALDGFAELTGGVAFLEAFSAEDEFDGDHEGFQARPARWYRSGLKNAGFTALGSHCWLSPALAGHAAALERADR